MNRNLISIIVPVYNVEKYLAECLNSVLASTFKDYEIICINDCSTDGSLTILKDYSSRFSNIHIIEHEHNKGLSASRNTGIKNAKGKYIFFLDSDDMITADALEKLYVTAEEKHTDMLFFNFKRIYEEGCLNRKPKTEPVYPEFSGVYTGKEMFENFSIANCHKVESVRTFYCRAFLLDNNLLFYQGILHEDNLFYFNCIMAANKVADLNEYFYIYRQRFGSIMGVQTSKRAESIFVVVCEIFKHWNKYCSEYDDALNENIKKYLQSLMNALKKYISFVYDKQVLSFENIAQKSLYENISDAFLGNPYVKFTYEQFLALKNYEHIIVYGAGEAAKALIDQLHFRNLNIKAVAVSDISNNPEYLRSIKIYPIDELLEYRKSAVVVIAVTKKYASGIEDNLRRLGFENVVTELE